MPLINRTRSVLINFSTGVFGHCAILIWGSRRGWGVLVEHNTLLYILMVKRSPPFLFGVSVKEVLTRHEYEPIGQNGWDIVRMAASICFW